EGGVNGRQQVRLGERLGDVVGGAELHRRDSGEDRPDRGHHDDGQVRLEAPELLQDLDPVDVRHEDVEQHEIHALRPGQAASAAAVADVEHRVAGVEDDVE